MVATKFFKLNSREQDLFKTCDNKTLSNKVYTSVTHGPKLYLAFDSFDCRMVLP